MRRLARALARRAAPLAHRLRRAGRRPVRREAGIALVVVTVAIAVLAVVTADLSRAARLELESATAARDEMRAHWLAYSAMGLGKLAMKVQQRVLDSPTVAQMTGGLQASDLLAPLMSAFAGKRGQSTELGDLLGLDTSGMRGLGLESGTFDLALGAEDGKINLNCFYPAVDDAASKKARLAALVLAEMTPRIYDPLFEGRDEEGQPLDRESVVRSIVDFVDLGEARFLGGAAPEDYRYEQMADPYEARDAYLDTLEEVRLARGVTDEIWNAFAGTWTIHGRCAVNLASIPEDGWVLVAALLRMGARNPDDPVLRDDTLLQALAQSILPMLAFITERDGQAAATSFAQIAANPTAGLLLLGLPNTMMEVERPDGSKVEVLVQGMDIDPAKLRDVVVGGPRKVYRLEAVGQAGRARRKITAVWNTFRYAQNDPAGGQGAWVYWREE